MQLSEDITIFDKYNKQGIIAQSDSSKLKIFEQVLREKIPFAIFISYEGMDKNQDSLRNKKISLEELKNLFLSKIELEFTSSVKTYLDEIRREILPTISFHHQLKIIDSNRVDEVEKNMENSQDIMLYTGKKLKDEMIYKYFNKGKSIIIEHVKPDGTLFEQTGKVIEFKNNSLRIERKFSNSGLYDGLNLPIEKGDRGEIEIKEGEWFIKRYYYTYDNILKGTIYNINTPVEFYPGRIRYVDLEIDIVKFPDGNVKVIDEEEFEKRVRCGNINKPLAQKVKDITKDVIEKIISERPDL